MNDWEEIRTGDLLSEHQAYYKSGDRAIIKYKHFDKTDFYETAHISENPFYKSQKYNIWGK